MVLRRRPSRSPTFSDVAHKLFSPSSRIFHSIVLWIQGKQRVQQGFPISQSQNKSENKRNRSFGHKHDLCPTLTVWFCHLCFLFVFVCTLPLVCAAAEDLIRNVHCQVARCNVLIVERNPCMFVEVIVTVKCSLNAHTCFANKKQKPV